MLTSLEKDTISRDLIVSEINKNFFVEAGAGSGKTTMLVNRMVAMVEAGIPIDKICAITFTKAAAGEFYDRFRNALSKRSNPDYKWEDKGYAGQLKKPTKETIARCDEALKNIDLCFMGTIDAFCEMILSEHPYEAGVLSDTSIIPGEEEKAFYRNEYVRALRGDFGPELSELGKAFSILYKKPDEVFILAIKKLMESRNANIHYNHVKHMDIDKTFESERKELIKVAECLYKNREELEYGGNQNSRDAWQNIGPIYYAIRGHWSNNFVNTLKKLKMLTDIQVQLCGLDKYGISLGDFFEPAKRGQFLIAIKSEDGSIPDKLEQLRYDISMTFLCGCIPYLEDSMRDKGNMSFFDCLYYLRNMLKEDAKDSGRLIRHIYNRHSYFLIDEFQDTNPLQAEVFFYLSGKELDPNWTKCMPKPGSLFIVGDPKQSIYRFRNADVTSFLRVKKLFENGVGDILTLSRNFRSTKELCAYFNSTFEKMLPEESDIQSKFEEIPLPDKREGEFSGIYKYNLVVESEKEGFIPVEDGDQILKIIELLVDNENYLITTEEDIEKRTIKYRDIMVITANKRDLKPIMITLNNSNIPTRVEGAVKFWQNDALYDIYCIFMALSDINDKAARYGALTTHAIGYDMEEVMGIKLSEGDFNLSRFPVLNDLYEKSHGLSPAALFSMIMDETRIYDIYPTDDLEVLYYTLELIRNAEKAGEIVSYKDCVSFMSNLIAEESEKERCLSLVDNMDAVHMANLHKIKGLEAPIVILAGARTNRIPPDNRMEYNEDQTDGYFFKFKSEPNENGIRTPYFSTDAFNDKLEEEKEADKAEKVRQVYVGATRARNALIICDKKDSKWKDLFEEGIPDIFETIKKGESKTGKEPDSINASDLYDKAEKECILNDRSVEKATYKAENPSLLKLNSKLSEGEEEDIVGDEEEKENHIFPALVGTMIHSMMEILVSSKGKADINDVVGEIISEYITPIYGPYKDKLTSMLMEAGKTMCSDGYEQKNGLNKDILNTLINADEVYCEVPFCFKENTDEGTILWNGVMDVVYRTGDKWHIIDYKTNADGKDIDKKYESQLNAYKKALKATTGNDADAFVYHIDI